MSVQYAGWERTAVRSQPPYCTALCIKLVTWNKSIHDTVMYISYYENVLSLKKAFIAESFADDSL